MKPGALKPCLLVASPALTCPVFNHSVVLLVDHRDDGSLGFVINRTAPISFEDVLKQVKLRATRKNRAAVLAGGPVSPETGWLVFDPSDGEIDDEDDGIIHVTKNISVSANMSMLERIAEGRGPTRRNMMLGYAGWGAGQLDEEIREGSWITLDLDPALVFEVPVAERWARALSSIGIDPGQMVSSVVAEA